jgi:hypothetical protein
MGRSTYSEATKLPPLVDRGKWEVHAEVLRPSTPLRMTEGAGGVSEGPSPFPIHPSLFILHPSTFTLSNPRPPKRAGCSKQPALHIHFGFRLFGAWSLGGPGGAAAAAGGLHLGGLWAAIARLAHRDIRIGFTRRAAAGGKHRDRCGNDKERNSFDHFCFLRRRGWEENLPRLGEGPCLGNRLENARTTRDGQVGNSTRRRRRQLPIGRQTWSYRARGSKGYPAHRQPAPRDRAACPPKTRKPAEWSCRSP